MTTKWPLEAPLATVALTISSFSHPNQFHFPMEKEILIIIIICRRLWLAVQVCSEPLLNRLAWLGPQQACLSGCWRRADRVWVLLVRGEEGGTAPHRLPSVVSSLPNGKNSGLTAERFGGRFWHCPKVAILPHVVPGTSLKLLLCTRKISELGFVASCVLLPFLPFLQPQLHLEHWKVEKREWWPLP